MTQPQIEKPEVAYEPVFVARQPVFSPERHIWGYELLFRHSGKAQGAQIDDQDVATARVIADGFVLGSSGTPEGSRFLINFPKNLLLKGSALALPQSSCIIEILETVEATPEIVASLKSFKEQGFTLALDDFVGQEGFEEILALADIVKVEVLGMDPGKLIMLTQNLRKYGVELLAEKIEDQKTFEMCKSLGYQYFQGYYFSKPELVSGRKISTGQLAKMQLLHKLGRDDYEVKDIARTIHQDTSLSYRLLTYLNSAAFGLTQKVNSISQAVTILGQGPLKQWLMVVVMADIDPSDKAGELCFKSVQRGRFLEMESLAMGHKSPYSSDTMFLLGLFSLLDSLLNQPMEEVIEHMPLDDELKAALLGDKNNARRWIDLVQSVETGDWDAVNETLDAEGLDQEQAGINYSRSMAWTADILNKAT